MKSRAKFGGLAVAAVTALSGLSVVGLGPSAAAAAVIAAKPYDFNGDGSVDVAVGSPYGTVGTVKNAGFVTVIYGSPSRLNTAKHQVFGQNTPNIPSTAEADDHFGYSLASADLDHDGYADLAIGVPEEDNANGYNAGTIDILWGSPSGLVVDSEIAALNEPDPAGPYHRWGEALAIGDIEHDGTPELFISIPGVRGLAWQSWGPRPGAATAGTKGRVPGAAQIMYRSAAHKVTRADGTSGRVDAPAGGSSNWLATGDVTGDGLDDVVWAWYGPDPVENPEDLGFIILPGIITNGRGNLDEENMGDGTMTDAHSAAVGDFDGDGFADVAIGQPADRYHIGGRVLVFPGQADVHHGLTVYAIDQDTPSVPGIGEAGDAFGSSLAAGDINHDGKDDLAVGAPTEDVNSIVDGGAAFVLFGSAGGLTGAGSQVVTQRDPGVPATAEKGDKYGYQVTLLDNNNDGYLDLTVGAPGENSGDGMLVWMKGIPSRVISGGSVAVYASNVGVKGKKAELGRRLGHIG
jgi:hypothetical protein